MADTKGIAAGLDPGEPNSAPEALRVDTRLLELLVCPLTRGPLEYDEQKQALISRAAGLVYPIRDGIPIMLFEEATRLEPKP